MSARVTIADLGRLLKLDKSTVSLALRGSEKIAPRTRSRVQAAAERYGYRPNLAAQRLRRSGPQVIALVLPDNMAALSSYVAVATMRRLADWALGEGVMFNMLPVAAWRDGHMSAMPDAAFVWGDIAVTDLLQIQRSGTPVVVLDPSHPSLSGCAVPSVEVANREAGEVMAEHLMACGCGRLLYVAGDGEHLGMRARWDGVRTRWAVQRAMEELDYTVIGQLHDSDLLRFVASGRNGIVAASDFIAVQLWHRLLAAGRQVPDNVKLAGFDGNAQGEMIGLTTTVFDVAALADAGIELLQALLRGEPASRRCIAFPLRPGKTTQA